MGTKTFLKLHFLKRFKVHIFWEGQKILRNLHLTFDCYTAILKNLNFCANSARSKTWSRKNISWIERKSLLTKPSNVLPFLHIKLNWRKNSKRTKVRWRFRKILWPSQNIRTLTIDHYNLNSNFFEKNILMSNHL